MPHVCIDARMYTCTGIGTFIKAALEALTHETFHRYSLLCKAEDMDHLKAYGHELIEMHHDIYTWQEQLEYVAKIPPADLFWSPHFNVPLLPIRAKKRMATIHDTYHLSHYSSLSLAQKIYSKIFYRAAVKRSDCVTTDSQFSKSEIEKWISTDKLVHVAEPGFDHFQPQISERPREDILLSVGNLKPHKNLKRLLLAYLQLKPKEKLYLVGKQENLKDLLNLVESEPYLKSQVSFTGYLTDSELEEMYKVAKLFIFPSTYEGFGYPPIEAMAYGCPVVASNAASIPEVCETAAEYVDPFSVEDIARGIGKVLRETTYREELKHKGKALFEKKKKQKNLIVDCVNACCNCS